MANRDMQFTHKALVQVKVAGVAFSLYPVLDDTITSAERAHGFHVNKSNLMATHLTPRQILLNAMGQQTGQSAVVEGAIAGLLRHFQDHWNNFPNLTIVSWHDSTGAIIHNTTTDGDSSILLPRLHFPVSGMSISRTLFFIPARIPPDSLGSCFFRRNFFTGTSF